MTVICSFSLYPGQIGPVLAEALNFPQSRPEPPEKGVPSEACDERGSALSRVRGAERGAQDVAQRLRAL